MKEISVLTHLHGNCQSVFYSGAAYCGIQSGSPSVDEILFKE